MDVKGEHYAPWSKGFDGRRNGGPKSQRVKCERKKKEKKFRHEKLTEAGGRALPVLREQSHQIHNAGITW